MQTGVLVDKGTYGLCITVGGPLWSTGNSLREKLLSSLVLAIVAWLCLSHTNWAAFCQSLAFILLFLQSWCLSDIKGTILHENCLYCHISRSVYLWLYEFITNHLVCFFCFTVGVDLSSAFSLRNFLILTLLLGPLSTVGFA